MEKFIIRGESIEEELIQNKNEKEGKEDQIQTLKLYNQAIIQDLENKNQFDKQYFTLQERVPRWKNPEKFQTPSKKSSFPLLILTWNQAGSNQEKFINQILNKEAVELHQIVVIASQECQRSILMSVFYENKQQWELLLRELIGKNFEMVCSQSMNAMHLCVFVKKQFLEENQIYNIGSSYIKTGFNGFVGNKGGIGISMNIGNETFLFLNCHLASGQNVSDKRIKMLQQIIFNIQLPPNYKKNNNLEKEEGLMDRFQYVFVMGDLNFRIDDSEIGIFDRLQNQDAIFLLKKDQLFQRMEQINFKEGIIDFMPTYRLNALKNTYTKDRIPGWTDRIIFQEKFKNHINLINYEANFNALGSDHRPVYAQFVVFYNKIQDNQEIKMKNYIPIKEQTGCNCQIF